MSTKDRVFSRLFDNSKHTTELKKAEANLNAKKKVALGLVDELDYDLDILTEETGRLNYAVEEFFDQEFDVMYDAYIKLYDVFFNNSEAFLTPGELDSDRQRLEEIRIKSEELGLSVEDVYPNYEEHIREIEFLTEDFAKFENRKTQFETAIRL